MTGASRPNGRTCREFFGSERRVGPEALRVAFLSVPEVLINIKNYLDDALVVDTTNYNGKGMIATSGAAARIKGIHESEALHVVERFKRLDANTISYEVTVDDPNVYSAPWKVSLSLTKAADYLIYEYACHEGNYAMEGILRAGRAKEKAAEAAAK